MSKKKKYSLKKRKQGLPPGSLIYTGHRVEAPTTVYSLRYNATTLDKEKAYRPEWLKGSEKSVLWIDIYSLTDVDFIQQVGNDFNLHPLLLEDVLDTQQRPKMEEYENGLFIIVPSLRLDPKTLDLQSEQIAFFLSEHFVLTFQEEADDDFAGVRKRAMEDIGRIRKKGTDYLAYALIDTIVDSYYTILDELETVLFELEEILHRDGDVPWCKGRIFDLRRAVNEFRHQMIPMRDAIARLHLAETTLIDDTNRVYIRDVVDHITQIIDGIDYQQSMLANTESLYHAEAANRLNHVMRLLAIISTIFMPLSFIAGVYGMNFDNIPGLHTQYGYFSVLGAMGVAMVAMLIYFRRKRWI